MKRSAYYQCINFEFNWFDIIIQNKVKKKKNSRLCLNLEKKKRFVYLVNMHLWVHVLKVRNPQTMLSKVDVKMTKENLKSNLF